MTDVYLIRFFSSLFLDSFASLLDSSKNSFTRKFSINNDFLLFQADVNLLDT